jgi:hypothetical protein
MAAVDPQCIQVGQPDLKICVQAAAVPTEKGGRLRGLAM